MGSASTSWNTITPSLREKFQVITFDLPGHGRTDFDPQQLMEPYALALLIKEQMDALGIRKAHFAGNSLGGWICLEIAAAFPDRTLSVTGLAPAGLWLVPTTHRTILGASSRFIAQYTYKFAGQMMKQQWARKLGFFEVSPRWRALPHDVIVNAVVAYGSSEGYFSARDGMLKRRFDKEILDSIPVTIVFGDTGANFTRAHACSSARSMGHAGQFRTCADVG
jgi:pimeloyl-ACP methyl ester carboxylesterase